MATKQNGPKENETIILIKDGADDSLILNHLSWWYGLTDAKANALIKKLRRTTK